MCDEDADGKYTYLCPYNTEYLDRGVRASYTFYMNPGGMREAKKKITGRQYNTRNRPKGPFKGIVVAHCKCKYTFGEGLDYSTDVVFLTDKKGQIVTMECPRCGRLCTAHPKHIF
jgi:hypothetical protein